jgi:hypothetical protein
MVKSFLFFVMTLGISLSASIIFASALHNILPIEGVLYTWIALVTAIIITVIVFMLRLFINWPNEWGALVISALVSLMITGLALIGYYFVQPFLNPPPTVTDVIELEERVKALETKMGEVEADLLRIGLTVQQIQFLQETYVRNGHLNVQDVAQLGLNQTQMLQVEALIVSRGLSPIDPSVRATEQAVIAQATETAVCYVRPLYRAVNVRITPEERDDNFLTFLMQREQVRVIGHNGGTINTTRWWLIELPNETEERRKQGWIASSVVKEINLSACNTLPQYAR